MEELSALHTPAPSHVELVAAYAHDHGLEVVEASEARHDVVVRAPVEAVDEAFEVQQSVFSHRGLRYRAHEGPIHLPEEIAEVVSAVLGLDQIPRHRPHGIGWRVGAGPGIPLDKLARRYDLPPGGELPRIAVLESGGYHASDLSAFFRGMGLRLPTVRPVHIRDGSGVTAENRPLDLRLLEVIGTAWKPDAAFEDVAGAARAALASRGALPSDPAQADQVVMGVLGSFEATAEVTMDLQILGGLAPGAPLDVYFTELSADGWRRALYSMIGAPYPGNDPQPTPAVLSVSWGGSEVGWGPPTLRVLHSALEAATRRGITICCSSGDWGSRNSRTLPRARPGTPAAPRHNVNFPASSPAVLACGGTAIAGEGEVVWNEAFMGARMASGGGMSGIFPRPPWQRDLAVPTPADTWIHDGAPSFDGRWLPDVAANAAFSSGVRILLGGHPTVGGGTSAATPIWAALAARLSGALGRPLGHLNAAFYAAPRGLTPIVEGNNDVSEAGAGVYSAAAGWNPCAGLGVPSGAGLLEGLMERESAGGH
jgi:kumamolisin